MKAWRVTVEAFQPRVVSIIAAETRAKAVSGTMRSAHDAGYNSLAWTDFAAKRAPEFDAWARETTIRHPVAQEAARRLHEERKS